MALPLYARLSLGFLALTLILGASLVAVLTWSNDRYHQELTQQLHEDLAQYVIDNLSYPLFDPAGDVDQKTLKTIAMNTMMINPSVEVYLIDDQGEVLGHALPDITFDAMSVDIEPVHKMMSDEKRGPVFGDNPRHPNKQALFSVAPVMNEKNLEAYLYVVLASQDRESMAAQLAGSHVARVTIVAALGLFVLLAISLFVGFRILYRPLRSLSHRVRQYRIDSLEEPENRGRPVNELQELETSFDLMKRRIQEQFDQLNENDRLRRELVSNISHDLRTPLAAMQGYVETVLIKLPTLSSEDAEQHLKTAHRHSLKLEKLIAQLFELSKLDAGRVRPNLEVFSITELLYDIKQDYRILAEDKEIELKIAAPNDPALVNADISLIERVIQNLLDNAFQHSPSGSSVTLEILLEASTIRIAVRDEGMGIEKHVLPHIFERHYQSSQPYADRPSSNLHKGGAGLGLNIVKKILELHQSVIEVSSEPHHGTCFNFTLVRPA